MENNSKAQQSARQWWHTPLIPEEEAEAEAGGFLSSRPAWTRERVVGPPELYKETCLKKNQTATATTCLEKAGWLR